MFLTHTEAMADCHLVKCSDKNTLHIEQWSNSNIWAHAKKLSDSSKTSVIIGKCQDEKFFPIKTFSFFSPTLERLEYDWDNEYLLIAFTDESDHGGRIENING